ncbi:hypothetical protein ABW20_dc0104174 [Dactylellina cionopaga]|nr:hypothetical protein ABW20_dc0104174 [Dactylellina cionopaga]
MQQTLAPSEKGVNARLIQQQARQRAAAAAAEAQRHAEETAQAEAESAVKGDDDGEEEVEDEEDEEEIGESSAAASRRRTRTVTKSKPKPKPSRGRRAAQDDEDEDMDDIFAEEEEEEEPDTKRGRRKSGVKDKPEEAKITLQAGRKRKRMTTIEVNMNPWEEDSDSEEAAPSTRGRRKPTKAQLKKQKQAEAKKYKKGRKAAGEDVSDVSDSDFEMELERAAIPIPGQIAFCAECNCRFTVTPYSRAGPDGDGLLCHACGKKNAPVEIAAKKKKQTTRTTKKNTARALLDGDATGVKSLQELCIQLVAKHIDDVEALGPIGSHNMDKICQIISRNRSLNDHTMKLFLEPAEHVLRFYDCSKIQSDNLRQIGAFVPTLRRLHLKFCGRMNDECLDYYGTQLKDLESLELYGAFNVTEPCFVRFFQNCGEKLKEFCVGDTARFQLAAVEALVDNCPDLEILRLRTLTNIDDECIRLLTGLPNLRVLEISNPALDLTDQPMVDMLNTCGSGLRELNLNGCIQLTDAVLDAIHESCGQLETLELEELDLLTNDGFGSLFTEWAVNANGLKHLNVTRCIGLEASGFARMIDHSGRSLEKLSLNSCKALEDEAWTFLKEFRMAALDEVDVSFIRSVTDEVVEGLMEVAPGMKIVRAWGCHKLTEGVKLREELHLVGREADILS